VGAAEAAKKSFRKSGKCGSCGNSFETEFYQRRYCSDKCRRAAKNTIRRTSKREGSSQRSWRLWTLYRLTEDDYATMAAFQHGVCAISKRPPKKQPLNVDHDHKTGEIRGLLDPWINQGLAYFKDSPALLRAAADYLESFPARAALGKQTYGMIGRARTHKKKMVYGPPATM